MQEEIISCIFNSGYQSLEHLQHFSVTMVVNLVTKTIMKSLNIEIKKIAEFSFSNGLCEHHNAFLEDMLLKEFHNKNIAIDICLRWVINTKMSKKLQS